MNLKDTSYFFGILAISVLHLTAQTTNDISQQIDLPPMVSAYNVSQEIRIEANKKSNAPAQINYLLSVLTATGPDASTNANFRKASALRYLALVAGTNATAINALVSNITFIDLAYNDHPAMMSLEMIGPPSIPAVMDIIIKTPDIPGPIPDAVQILMSIKGRDYSAFVKEQKDKMPYDRWMLMRRYSIHD